MKTLPIVAVWALYAVVAFLAYGKLLAPDIGHYADDLNMLGYARLTHNAMGPRVWVSPSFGEHLYRPLGVIETTFAMRLLGHGWLLHLVGIVNLVLAAGAVFGLTSVAFRLFGRQENAFAAGALGGLLFVAWPSHGETVVGLCTAPDGLSALFCAASVWLALLHRQRGCLASYLASLVILFLALLSKEAAFALPFVLVVVLLMRFPASRPVEKPFHKVAGVLAVSCVYLLMRHHAIGAFVGGYADSADWRFKTLLSYWPTKFWDGLFPLYGMFAAKHMLDLQRAAAVAGFGTVLIAVLAFADTFPLSEKTVAAIRTALLRAAAAYASVKLLDLLLGLIGNNVAPIPEVGPITLIALLAIPVSWLVVRAVGRAPDAVSEPICWLAVAIVLLLGQPTLFAGAFGIRWGGLAVGFCEWLLLAGIIAFNMRSFTQGLTPLGWLAACSLLMTVPVLNLPVSSLTGMPTRLEYTPSVFAAPAWAALVIFAVEAFCSVRRWRLALFGFSTLLAFVCVLSLLDSLDPFVGTCRLGGKVLAQARQIVPKTTRRVYYLAVPNRFNSTYSNNGEDMGSFFCGYDTVLAAATGRQIPAGAALTIHTLRVADRVRVLPAGRPGVFTVSVSRGYLERAATTDEDRAWFAATNVNGVWTVTLNGFDPSRDLAAYINQFGLHVVGK